LLSILSHLFRNAIRAMSQAESEPMIMIETSVVGKMAVITVQDNGPGVAPDIIPMLFKETISHEDRSGGSGLLLIRFIAEQYRGDIELIEQREHRGACFQIHLPVVVTEESNH
jgi:sensor histidine kinase regulating citrate/malate metabolism